jgi:hypothetical protein
VRVCRHEGREGREDREIGRIASGEGYGDCSVFGESLAYLSLDYQDYEQIRKWKKERK